MGSVGKSATVSIGVKSTNNGTSNNPNDYSDVYTHKTAIPKDDIDIITNGSTGYIGTGHSFLINRILRESESDADLRNTLKKASNDPSVFGNTDEDKFFETLNTMDRNMKPLNGNIQVARMAELDFMTSVLKQINMDGLKIGFGGKVDENWLYANVDKINDTLSGAIITEKSYISTTYDLTMKRSFFASRPIKLEMNVAKGANALFSPFDDEAEMVRARSSSYKVNGFRWDSSINKFVMSVDVYPD